MNKIRCLVESDPETGMLVGSVPGVSGAHSQGKTLDELKLNLTEVLGLIEEHTDVVIKRPIQSLNLDSGATGVVVHTYPGGSAYEVEFFGEDGRTLSVETIEADELTPKQIAALRADAEKYLPKGALIWRQSLFPRIPVELHITSSTENDGRHIAEVPELSGTLAYGETRVEAMAKAQALALRVLADRLENGETEASGFRFSV